MTLRITFPYKKGSFPDFMRAQAARVEKAKFEAISKATERAKTAGRAHLASKGTFGRGFVNALRSKTYKNNGRDAGGLLWVRSNYIGAFEDGPTVVSGKPLLWIPFFGVPQKIGRQRMTPALFARRFGPLSSVRRGGTPMLVASVTAATAARLGQGQRAVGKKARTRVTVIAFIGVPRVVLPDLTDLRGVIRAEHNRIPTYYFEAFRRG